MAAYLQASSGNCSTFVPEITRRSADYHPSIWGDQFLAYDSSDQVKTDADIKEHFQQLKEEVKKMLVEAGSQQLDLIDGIQRLGVAYHFEAEIDAALQGLNNVIFQENDQDDLHTVSLRFRLLRHHGYNVSSDVFRKFKDIYGKFKECLISDPRGMLSLYEATHLRVHEEYILEDALEFTTSHLERLKCHLKNPLAAQVDHALKYPIRKGLTRLEAKHYISIYQEEDSHNKVLLDFAKLDFNLLQKVHQGELAHITRWWKDLNFAKKLPFARDRVVECYFWILGVYFEPQYLMARRILTKIISVTSIVDDIYDVYGTFEELLLFTDAIERWDISSIDHLPEYMRVCYQALFNVYSEIEEITKAGRPSYRLHYAKDSFKELVRAYLAEAKWLHEGYVPKIEEYMHVAMVSGAYKMLATNSFVLMGDLVTKEAFDWVSSNPLIVKASSVICRLSDDMVGHEFEQKREHVASAVECYIKQHGAITKQKVYAEFQKQITNAWKDMNQECLHPTAVEMPLLARVFNMARVINLLYDEEDGYTNSSTRTKDFITLVLIDPVPL